MSLGLEELRDGVIVVAGIMTILVLLAVFITTVVLGLAARTLLGGIQTLVRDEVTPLMKSAHQTAQRVRGTTTFIGETAVAPVIRVYSVVAGARRAIGVLSGVTGRRRRRG